MTSERTTGDRTAGNGAGNGAGSGADRATGVLLPALTQAEAGFAILQPSGGGGGTASDHLTLVYGNPAHHALLGWPDGSGTSPVHKAAVTVLQTGEPALIGELPVGERVLRVTASPVRIDPTVTGVTDVTGVTGVTGVTVVTVDITDQVQARRRLEDRNQRLSVLDETTIAVTAEPEPTRELVALAESVVPSLADACAVYLMDHTPAAGPVTDPLQATRLVCVIDPALGLAPPAPEVRLRLAPTRPVARAAQEARAVLARGPQVDPREWGERWLTQLDPHSLVAMPIGHRGAVRAVVSLAATGKRPRYQDSDIALMREITARVDAAVGRALHQQHTSQVALALQRGLLSEPPAVDGLEIQVRYRPAGPGLEIGGDWYDAFLLPSGDLALTVGDIVGHDLHAASTMGQLRSMVQALASQQGAEPAKVMTALNRLCTHLRVGELATVVHGQLTRPAGSGPARFSWANAGHPPPLLVGPDRSVTVLDRTASPLLCLFDTGYAEASVAVPAGAILLLYSDGLMEDPDNPTADAIHNLAKAAGDGAADGLDALCDQLLATAPSRDDIALLAVHVLS